ncbi:KDEL-tailed cysteine endopeptidase CEP3-like [Rhododendron vialii]|uniref:KDEL-tailed cysteine endopeptidase CEP3-like n=1 Tax=Rhododendron vialii TaxID=182163 RepID=UPI00265E5470|nr:KDEL-tailed cysteine endopeptidase CEP3-like [Rhododendron vialii]
MCWAIVCSEAVAAGRKLRGEIETLLLELASQELLDCCEREKKECYTYSLQKTFQWIETNGIRKEVEYPFIAEKCDCRPKSKEESASAVRIKGVVKVNPRDEVELLKAVWMQPIAGAIKITKEFNALKGEIYEGSTNYSLTAEGKPRKHAILIVGYGYDEKEEKAYWIIKNSWGTEWGINGYARIDRSSSLLFATQYPIFE